MSDIDPTQETVTATPTTVDTTATSTQSQAAPQGATPPATPTSGQPGSATSPTSGAPGEGWVPSYRLREQREALARQVQEREASLRAHYDSQLQDLNKKLQVLAGVAPGPNPEVEGVKQQFAELYPKLAKLADADVDRLLQVMERVGDFEQQNDHYWQSYGQQRVANLFELAEKDIGQPLTDAGKERLHSALVGYVQSSPQAMEAYSRDPNFISTFWKAWSSDFIEPVRRVAGATAQGRAGLPAVQDVPGQVRTTPASKPDNLDDRLAMGWTSYQQTKKP